MRTRLALVAVTAAALVLTACGTDDADTAPDNTSPSAGADAFPVTIRHAYGTTTIEQQPERVATVAWGSSDAALALGVVPVGMAAQPYGDTDGDDLHSWTLAAIESLDGEVPTLFDEADGIDFEAVADTAPDVILAMQSGLTQEEYDTLSEIAHVVAYPDKAWGTEWQDVLTMAGDALGLRAEADAEVAELQGLIDEAVAANPQIEGKTAMFTYLNATDLSTIGYYTAFDARAEFLTDLGLAVPDSVASLSEGEEFYGAIDAENADLFDDVDVLFGYGDDASLAAFQDDALVGKIPAIAAGATVLVEDGGELAAGVSPPTALSLPALLDEYVAMIAAASDQVS